MNTAYQLGLVLKTLDVGIVDLSAELLEEEEHENWDNYLYGDRT